MKRWEYKLIDMTKMLDTYAPFNEKIMRGNTEGIRWKIALDNLGKQGWEYVEHGQYLHGHESAHTYVFKRELKQ